MIKACMSPDLTRVHSQSLFRYTPAKPMTMILNNNGWLKEGRKLMQSFKYFGLSISQHLTWTTSLKGSLAPKSLEMMDPQRSCMRGIPPSPDTQHIPDTFYSPRTYRALYGSTTRASTTGVWNDSQYTHTRIHSHTHILHMDCWHQHISAPSHFINGSIDKKCYSIFLLIYFSFLIFNANHTCEAICDFLFLALKLEWTHS